MRNFTIFLGGMVVLAVVFLIWFLNRPRIPAG